MFNVCCHHRLLRRSAAQAQGAVRQHRLVVARRHAAFCFPEPDLVMSSSCFAVKIDFISSVSSSWNNKRAVEWLKLLKDRKLKNLKNYIYIFFLSISLHYKTWNAMSDWHLHVCIYISHDFLLSCPNATPRLISECVLLMDACFSHPGLTGPLSLTALKISKLLAWKP